MRVFDQVEASIASSTAEGAPCLGISLRNLWPDGKSEDARTTSLSDEGHARRYALLIIRELKARPDYRHAGQRMVVRSENGNMVHIISF